MIQIIINDSPYPMEQTDRIQTKIPGKAAGQYLKYR